LKSQRFTLSGYKDIGIRKFEFVAKTQFLSGDFFKYQDHNLSEVKWGAKKIWPDKIYLLRPSTRQANKIEYSHANNMNRDRNFNVKWCNLNTWSQYPMWAQFLHKYFHELSILIIFISFKHMVKNTRI